MCHITKPKEEYQSQYGLNQKNVNGRMLGKGSATPNIGREERMKHNTYSG